ncbi:MAG: WD40/YVTN/BNR-like repeat-containing protein, partial [Phycisphaerae bacterium]
GDLYHSMNGGDTWAPIVTPEEFTVIHVHDGVLYGAGILQTYHSLDNGKTWLPQQTGLPIFTSISSISSNDSFVFAVSATGLYRSANQGVDWVSASPPGVGGNILDFLPGPTIGYLLARENETITVWRTTDNGMTWVPTSAALPDESISARAVVHVAEDGALFAGTGTGLFVSEDEGTSFVDANAGFVGTGVTSLDGRGARLMAIANHRTLWTSTDAGATWVAQNAGLESQPRTTRIRMLDESTALLGTASLGVFRTVDGGLNWSAANLGITGFNGSAGQQFHQINDFASNGTTIIASSGGGTISLGGEHGGGGFGIAADGIFRSTNQGTSWQRITSGIPIVANAQSGSPVFEAVHTTAAINGTFYASMASRGVLRSDNDGLSWSVLNAGLPSNGAAFPALSAFEEFGGSVFAANASASSFFPGAGVFRFDIGSSQWMPAATGLPINRPVRDLFAWEGELLATLDAESGGDVVVYSSVDGVSWVPFEPQLQNLRVQTLAAAESDLFVSTHGQGIWTLATTLTGDTNCDGIVSVSDIAPFVLALTDPAAYTFSFPACEIASADINQDSEVSVGDIGAFVQLLTGS